MLLRNYLKIGISQFPKRFQNSLDKGLWFASRMVPTRTSLALGANPVGPKHSRGMARKTIVGIGAAPRRGSTSHYIQETVAGKVIFNKTANYCVIFKK